MIEIILFIFFCNLPFSYLNVLDTFSCQNTQILLKCWRVFCGVYHETPLLVPYWGTLRLFQDFACPNNTAVSMEAISWPYLLVHISGKSPCIFLLEPLLTLPLSFFPGEPLCGSDICHPDFLSLRTSTCPRRIRILANFFPPGCHEDSDHICWALCVPSIGNT